MQDAASAGREHRASAATPYLPVTAAHTPMWIRRPFHDIAILTQRSASVSCRVDLTFVADRACGPEDALNQETPPTLTVRRPVYYNRPMLCHVHCPACGGDGTILVEDPALLPRCPTCGHPLGAMQPTGRSGQATVDTEQILSWLSESGPTQSSVSSPETTCATCGYTGPMERDPDRGGMFCPACLGAYRPRANRLTRTFDCPDCGTAFELAEHDRGKTIVCPACKHFLGCVWLEDKRGRRLFERRA
jgi:hypothetical protein